MSSINSLDNVIFKINELIPKNSGVTKVEFEGPEVAIYSKNIDVLLDDEGLISKIARTIRKRVVIRSDPSIRLPFDKTKNIIKNIFDDLKLNIGDIDFDETIGEVIIQLERPSQLKSNSTSLVDITLQTKWRPKIIRIPH